ncbi:4'-phosphopantetheinyl transferase superfamily protein [Clostridium gasigenes]|uniref:4'-phosphopantetheinyl transferase family protein n=1 Tax=Clostridium gasigenes TaxID=94869 RepID=UPI001C0DD768|nr:4'-phosphopantetheinyl transferase superfamily protein [Clostridium gasigenes]MBU3134177.1 4'-phosphopantetheinyl transferase superfamily protein [Clostridium gasigenes]
MEIIIINSNNFLRVDVNELQENLFEYGLDLRKVDSILGYLTVIQYMKKKLINPTILFDNNGKPYCKESPIKFNISHSNDIVVCAFSEVEIGIDVEYINFQNKEICNIYSLVLSNTELLEIHLLSEQKDRIHYFYQLWCCKESYVKKIGIGLKKKFSDIDIKKILPEEVCFSEIRLDDHYYCVACTDTVESIQTIEIRNFNQWKLEMGLTGVTV